MIGNARGSHSSPGIYTKEIDLSYASKTLGITTLGVVGETLKGPAFEPIKIENWKEFVNYFGGTSFEKFSGSQYPKYELPYIAKSYLKNSNQLEVCRVLGLSGYNAGPAWLITAEMGAKEVDMYVEFTGTVPTGVTASAVTEFDAYKKVGDNEYVTYDKKTYKWGKGTIPAGNKHVIVVLRSRGSYKGNDAYDACSTASTVYDKLTYVATNVALEQYASASRTIECEGVYSSGSSTSQVDFTINEGKYGKFTIVVTASTSTEPYRYPVSLNPADKDYILNVIGTTPSDGIAPIFVEELYDVALADMIERGVVDCISSGVTKDDKGLDEEMCALTPDFEPVFGIYDSAATYNVNSVGQTYLDVQNAKIYTIEAKKGSDGKRTYGVDTGTTVNSEQCVYVLSEDRLYRNSGNTMVKIDTDINDYKEQYRCASTPWVVSELKGDGTKVEVKKLFRFHTISDGNAANEEVKISIQNIRPDEGLFDVVVRAFDDMDSMPTVLERFTKCSMVPGTNNFIGFKIGTFDGEYIVKSKYVTVEVIANDMTESCIPAGFLGYPIRVWGKDSNQKDIKNPEMGYNTMVIEDIKPKKQYFGFSNLKGIDVDLFKYKGKCAYDRVDSMSDGFHLDSRIKAMMDADTNESKFTLAVDDKTGYTFTTVSPNNVVAKGSGSQMPKIGSEHEMEGTIYEDVNLRKFTMCFYGGFDGWDPYRDSRTNTDEFKANKYKGKIENGFGANFSQINNPEGLELTGKCITSDYYAYLAGARQFCNPEAVDINIFATPGIDYVNQTMLSQEILSMVEEERGDTLYVMTTPDKPFGNDDADMYYPDEVVSNLEDAEIDSSYAATYYPWVKYYDADNSVYINLPATKDVVSAMAFTDNVSYPWFAPAGTVRGAVDCERAHFITKLEDEDTLYEGMINPIKTFAADGVKIWGQKTMYGADTPLNRINVRRLMLRVKKLITGACRRLIFEQNDATVKAQFEGLVKPILDDIKSKRGIYDYRLEVNDSAEARDRLELPAVIYIKPTKALEYIDISFVIMPESVAFNE